MREDRWPQHKARHEVRVGRARSSVNVMMIPVHWGSAVQHLPYSPGIIGQSVFMYSYKREYNPIYTSLNPYPPRHDLSPSLISIELLLPPLTSSLPF